jgi:hypothetical protein
VPAFLTAYPALYGKEFAPSWWYTDYPFCQDGRTWLLDKGWRRDDTEPMLKVLCERFPQAGVSFRRADP